jgi:hypothetical protein
MGNEEILNLGNGDLVTLGEAVMDALNDTG